jgi:predicted 3-demethylubiquinone-9 3-methyltransferase (glyoxalase superfamily)
MPKITPFLWFDSNAEEAMNFYASVFKDSQVVSIIRNREGGMGPEGAMFSATFLLQGQEFIALNGGPHFRFTPAISLLVTCDTQEEVDELWAKLCAGGEPNRCGWLTDRFGLSWQIVPRVLGEMLQDHDVAKANRVMQAMLKMIKLDIADLRQAYDQP